MRERLTDCPVCGKPAERDDSIAGWLIWICGKHFAWAWRKKR
jgi:hypothetical protein